MTGDEIRISELQGESDYRLFGCAGFAGCLRSISSIIRSAQRTASAMAATVAGIRAPLSY